MATIAFAWELGANFGHLSRQLPVALELRRRGHDVVFVVCDVRSASDILTPHALPFLAAPLAVPAAPSRGQPTLNYSHLLLAYGYATAAILRPRVQAWAHLLTRLHVDGVVIDHAPTALIAARTLSLPAVQLGTGFLVPPQTDPLPSFRARHQTREADLVSADRQALDTINSVLRSLSCAPLERMAALFADAPALLSSFAELDHYGTRETGRYVGPITMEEGLPEVSWPVDDGPRVFAYLNANAPGIDAVTNAIRNVAAHRHCVIPGVAPALRAKLERSGIIVHASPIDIRSALRGASVTVCYGGAGTVTQSLLAGVPLLIIPQQIEQRLLATRVDALGAGIIDASQDQRTIEGAFARVLAEPKFRTAANEFQRRYATFDPVAAIGGCANVIVEEVSRTE